MMRFEKYKFREYNPKYKIFYQREKDKLKKILPKNIQIEHIGSTAILGLGGKGIIDILMGVNKKDISKIKKKLQKHHYSFPIGGHKNRLYAEKDYKSKGKIRRLHLHIVQKNSKEWKNPLKVRNQLKKNKDLAREYTKLKKKSIKIAKGEGKIYKNYKKSFLDRIQKK